MHLCAFTRTAHDGAVGPTEHKAAGFEEEARAGFLFELFPKDISMLNQRHVGGTFEIGFADDSRLPMRGAEIVRRSKTLQSQNPQASISEVEGSGAAHGA